MPEETDDFIHIPIKDKGMFEEKSFRTITIAAAKGIKAVIGKLNGESTTTVQKYLFAKSKGWTMAKAKSWVKSHKKKQVADIGEVDMDVIFTMPFERINADDIASLKDLTRLGIDVEEGGIYTKGTAFIEDINRNQWRAGIKNIETENYMKTPITLFNHNPDVPTGRTVYLKKTKDSIEVITHVTTNDEKMRADIENGTINAHSIRVNPFAVERVCLENDACFFDILSCDLIEISHVTLNAVVGTNFKVLAASYEPIGKIVDRNKQNPITGIGSADNTTSNIKWTSTDNGIWALIPYADLELPNLDDIEEKSKVEKSMTETPEPPKTDVKIKVKAEVEGEDLSSAVNINDEIEARLRAVEETAKAMAEKEAKLAEQTLNLQVEKTMTLFTSVENKTDIKANVATIAKCGGKDALDAFIATMKIVMESKVITDSPLTPSGGEGMSAEDKLSVEMFGKPVAEMVAELGDNPIARIEPQPINKVVK